VCGRLRERFPDRSVYNRLCDIEWDRPAGNTDACGGIVMARAAAFGSVNGFREDMIAGEEPELCSRLRLQGWMIWRLADDMALHDAAMLHFRQWWKRTQRTGFGYAQSVWMQAAVGGEKLQSRRALSSWIWAGVLPLTTALASLAFGLPSLVLLLAYPAQVLRAAAKIRGPWRRALERGFFLVLGRFPELIGQIQFWARRSSGRKSAPSFDYKV
jgi:GT2 family glycosyltransferase